MFLAPKFFGERTLQKFGPNFQKKIQSSADHSAKFCGNQPTELGDPVLKK